MNDLKIVDQSESCIFNHSSNDSDDQEEGGTKNKSPHKQDEKLNESYFKHIPPPNPILPKHLTITEYEPPKCPIKHIYQLKKFKSFEQEDTQQTTQPMEAGYDHVEFKKKDLSGGEKVEAPVVTEEQIIQQSNIVFCRMPQCIKDKESLINIRTLVNHENYLDIKSLVKAQQSVITEDVTIKKRKTQNQSSSIQKLAKDDEAAVYQLKSVQDRTLVFESRFESGNLFLAQKVSDSEYNLLMQNDINTNGHTQWFYFRVQNTFKDQRTKPDSLFNQGMKITMYSEKKAEQYKTSWFRGCTDISYRPNSIKRGECIGKNYYTLTFSYTFEYTDDSVFFAYCFPYTYSDLMEDLIAIEQDAVKSQFAVRRTLCQTLANVNCEYLTITSRDNMENLMSRKAVIISARVHPGETVGSWMMRGVLQFLTDPNDNEAKILRDNFIFKIIPMLNPDGVINGNYRSSLAGCDLNRRWKMPSKYIHPTIYHTKKLIKTIHAERTCLLFCDLHGHSRKQNVFMYGCNNSKAPEETRVFPYLLSKVNPYFSFEDSRFGIQKSKEATARVALYKELKTCPNIFTMESTFSGLDRGPMKGMHITTAGLQKMGKDLCRTLLIYSDIYYPPEFQQLAPQENTTKPPQLVQQSLQTKGGVITENLDRKQFKEDQVQNQPSGLKQMFMNELKQNKELLKKGEGDSSGSDSAPSEDNLNPEEIVKMMPIVDKATKQQVNKMKKKIAMEEKKREKQLQKSLKKSSSKQGLKEENKDKLSVKKLSKIEENKKNDLKLESYRKSSNGSDEVKKPVAPIKPKPVMVDAWTQTERSDYSIIKSRMLNHQQYANSLITRPAQNANPKVLIGKAGKSHQYAKTPTQFKDQIMTKQENNIKHFVFQQSQEGGVFRIPQNYQSLMEQNISSERTREIAQIQSPQMLRGELYNLKQTLNSSHIKQQSENIVQESSMKKINNNLYMTQEQQRLYDRYSTQKQTMPQTPQSKYQTITPQSTGQNNLSNSMQNTTNGITRHGVSYPRQQDLQLPMLNNKLRTPNSGSGIESTKYQSSHKLAMGGNEVIPEEHKRVPNINLQLTSKRAAHNTNRSQKKSYRGHQNAMQIAISQNLPQQISNNQFSVQNQKKRMNKKDSHKILPKM